MSLGPTQHPPVQWLTLRQTAELPGALSLIVDCHRSVCAVCDARATGVASPAVLDHKSTSTGLPHVLADWLDSAERTRWDTTAVGVECIDLSREGGVPVWLERRAPTGQNSGWDGDGACVGLMLAGAVSVDGNRLSRGDVLISCTEKTIVRVVSSTAAVFRRGCTDGLVDPAIVGFARATAAGVS
jgi:hypothetical protein